MSYEPDIPPETPCDRDADLDPRQLLADIAALIDAGLVAPVRARDGVVRVTPTAPLVPEGRAAGGRGRGRG